MKSTYVYEHWCQAIPREARRRLLLGVRGSGRLAFRHDVFVMRQFNAKLMSVMKSTYIYEHWCKAIPREARGRLLLGVPGFGRLAFRHDVFVMREFNAKLKSVMKSTYIYEHWCQAIPREARRRLLLGVPSCRRLAFRHDVSCHVIGNIPRQISRRPHSCSGSAIASS